MSRAFVKEEEGSAWKAPETPRKFQVIWHDELGRSKQVYQHDDLLCALNWMCDERRPELELRRRDGGLLAQVAAAKS